jgi:hypothetical protein
MSSDDRPPVSTWARQPFLDLLVANCVMLAEDCTVPRTRRVLRLLAADLAMEAEWYRTRGIDDDAALALESARRELLTMA